MVRGPLYGMIHTDHLATPHKMTDGTGTVVWSAYYKPFGAATVTVSTITNNLRFPGQYYDVETGNYYNYYRDYSSAIGRYLEVDPVGIEHGYNNLYAYARNNALNWIDPEGLEPRSTLGGDDPGFEDPEAMIRDLEKQLKDECLSQKEKEKIRRRIKELRRRASGRQQHHYSPVDLAILWYTWQVNIMDQLTPPSCNCKKPTPTVAPPPPYVWGVTP
jgi:RHS repeat-associated protein